MHSPISGSPYHTFKYLSNAFLFATLISSASLGFYILDFKSLTHAPSVFRWILHCNTYKAQFLQYFSYFNTWHFRLTTRKLHTSYTLFSYRIFRGHFFTNFCYFTSKTRTLHTWHTLFVHVYTQSHTMTHI